MQDTNLDDFRGRRKANPRTETCGTAMSLDERNEVYAALRAGGHANPSVGVRAVLFAYRDSPEVRAAVAQATGSLEAAA